MKQVGIWIVAVLIALGGYFIFKQENNNTLAQSTSVTQQQSNAKTNSQLSKQEPKKENMIEISQITPSMEGRTVVTRGHIIKLSSGKGNVFFTYKDVNSSATIKGVLFKEDNYENTDRKALLENCRLNNSIVYVKGKVAIYQGELEIIAYQVFKDE